MKRKQIILLSLLFTLSLLIMLDCGNNSVNTQEDNNNLQNQNGQDQDKKFLIPKKSNSIQCPGGPDWLNDTESNLIFGIGLPCSLLDTQLARRTAQLDAIYNLLISSGKIPVTLRDSQNWGSDQRFGANAESVNMLKGLIENAAENVLHEALEFDKLCFDKTLTDKNRSKTQICYIAYKIKDDSGYENANDAVEKLSDEYMSQAISEPDPSKRAALLALNSTLFGNEEAEKMLKELSQENESANIYYEVTKQIRTETETKKYSKSHNN